MTARTNLWVCLLGALACGGASVAAPAPVMAPVSDADPPPYTPRPMDVATTGSTVALATSGGGEQALAVALHLLEAVRDGDERALERLLAEELTIAQPRPSGAQRTRADIISRVVNNPRRRVSTTSTLIENLIDRAGIRVQPLSEVVSEVPPQLRTGDLHVLIPLTPQGRRILRFFLQGWHHRGVVIVRTGVEPRIVGL